MKAAKSIHQVPRLPADVTALNEIAKANHLRVDIEFADDSVTIIWGGYTSRLQATGLVRPSSIYPHVGRLRVPHDEFPFDEAIARPFINGEIHITSVGRFTLEAKFQLPNEIRDANGVEICRSADRISWYGTADALIAAGVCTANHLPLGKRATRRCIDIFGDKDCAESARWMSRRHPSGMMIHYRESENAVAARIDQNLEKLADRIRWQAFLEQRHRDRLPKAHGHLQLVVDKTRDDKPV